METIDSINLQLRELFGVDTVTGLQIWRVVWSEDQTEKQLDTYTDYTPNGIFIREVTEVREIKKYPWIQEKWVLEQLAITPEYNLEQLCGVKLAYGAMYPFEDEKGFPLPPNIEFCKFIINTVNEAKNHGTVGAKYKDEIQENPIEATKARVEKLYKDLYGNETDVTDTLSYKEGIVVPKEYES